MGASRAVTLPQEFGSSWDIFVADWCLGTPPVPPAVEVIAALDALKRLCPDHAGALLSSPVRGSGVILPAIDLGHVLLMCEKMPGFEKILPRLRRGDRSAISEAQFAAGLARVGCKPEIEPQVGTAMLDTAIEWHGIRIYAEVISPERAEAVVSAQADLQALANAIRDSVSGSVVEVLLETDISSEVSEAVLRSLAEVSGAEPLKIEGLATFARRPASVPLQVGPTLPYAGPGPVVAAAAGRVDGAVAAAGVVRMPILDSRARRLLADELHHFSKETHNVLAIDITAVTVGPQDWAALIRRSLQPAQNRRVGAVILFSRGLVGLPLAIRQAWTVVANGHAYRIIPDEFLAEIRSLDESAYYRGTPPE